MQLARVLTHIVGGSCNEHAIGSGVALVYMAKVNKLEENSKNKNIREICKGINEFKKGYEPRAYVIKKDCSRNN